MESSKVKLPKEVAEAIEHARREYNDVLIVQLQMDPAPWTAGRDALDGFPLDTLIRALYIGYEVEQTPEDEVRELYDEYKTNEQKARVRNDTDAEERLQLAAFAIRETLDALNIKIKGVNDHE